MWALIVDGSINRIFKYPTAFKHPTTGIQYPRNWLNLASDSEKASVGFIEITYSGSNKIVNIIPTQKVLQYIILVLEQ